MCFVCISCLILLFIIVWSIIVFKEGRIRTMTFNIGQRLTWIDDCKSWNCRLGVYSRSINGIGRLIVRSNLIHSIEYIIYACSTTYARRSYVRRATYFYRPKHTKRKVCILIFCSRAQLYSRSDEKCPKFQPNSFIDL